MRTILGHLAQFASFARQGELLCTQGLNYLLDDASARTALADIVHERTGVRIGAVTWFAEVIQDDRGRPDLEAQRADGVPVVKVEGKLGAVLSHGQLRSYLEHMHGRAEACVLIVLVPKHRVNEATGIVRALLVTDGDGPWRSPAWPCAVTDVMNWEDLLTGLRDRITDPAVLMDLAQLKGLYDVLRGWSFEPLADRDALLAWRSHEEMFLRLVDRLTRELSNTERVMPFVNEPLAGERGDLEPKGYRLRYVSRQLGNVRPSFCVGARDPFSGHVTPLWLRFHRDTPAFGTIRARLLRSSFGSELVDDSGHAWLPLDGPWGIGGDELHQVLVARTNSILDVAFRDDAGPPVSPGPV